MNEERKRQFLKERRRSAEISTNIDSWFALAAHFEELYGRDICEWTSTEIIRFAKYLSTAKIQTLILFKNSLSFYVDWCIANRLVSDNQNHFAELTTETLCECVDINKLKGFVFSREELLENISQLPNYSDRFIFLGLFEGIPRMDLARVTLDDLEGNTLHLKEKDLEISDELASIIQQAAEETTWTSMRATERVFDCEPGDTLIKKLAREHAQSNPSIIIGSRFRECLKYMGLSTEISAKNIAESGRIEYIRKLMRENDMEMPDVISRFRPELEERYGKIQNLTTYAYTYGRFV